MAMFASLFRRTPRPQIVVSKISVDQIVGTPPPANIHPGSSGAYQVPVGIEGVQEAPFSWMDIRLNSPQRTFVYKE